MEKKLNKMKAAISDRIKRLTGLIACTVVFLGASVSGVIDINLGSESANDFVAGFQLGILMALTVVFLYKLVNYRKAMKDETLLKRLYYKENDERLAFINQQVGKSSMSVTTVVLLIGAVIAGYFDIKVFVTILAVTFVQLVIQLILQRYYTCQVSGEDAE